MSRSSVILRVLVPVAFVILLGVLAGRLRLIQPEQSDVLATLALNSTFPNVAFIGVPVFTAVLGKSAMLLVVIGNLIGNLVLVPLMLILLAAGSPTRSGTKIPNHVEVPCRCDQTTSDLGTHCRAWHGVDKYTAARTGSKIIVPHW